MMTPDDESVQERIEQNSYIDENGCRVWTGRRDQRGRGLITLPTGHPMRNRDGTARVHLLAYRLTFGWVPKSGETRIIQRCGNPACSNPFHLEAVSQSEVKVRTLRAARIARRNGEQGRGPTRR